jgi:hypothetical protein
MRHWLGEEREYNEYTALFCASLAGNLPMLWHAESVLRMNLEKVTLEPIDKRGSKRATTDFPGGT